MTELIPPALSALFWFGLGAVFGAQWTRMGRDVRRLKAKAGERETAVRTAADDQPAPAHPPRWLRMILDAVVVLLFLGSAVQAYVTYDRFGDIIACQNGYQAGFADALDARSKATQDAQDALDDLMSTVGRLIAGGPSPEVRQQFATALTGYLDKRAQAKKRQQEYPYPPSPRDVCK